MNHIFQNLENGVDVKLVVVVFGNDNIVLKGLKVRPTSEHLILPILWYVILFFYENSVGVKLVVHVLDVGAKGGLGLWHQCLNVHENR